MTINANVEPIPFEIMYKHCNRRKAMDQEPNALERTTYGVILLYPKIKQLLIANGCPKLSIM